MDKVRDRSRISNIHDPIGISANDIEIRDILGRRHLAERILKRLGEADCPNVIGVYGGWGTGKTSLVNLLVHYNGGLDGQNFRILNVDAWKYESSDGLLVPIIVRFKELTGNVDLPDVWKPIAKRVIATAGIALLDGLLSPFRVGPSQIGEIYEKLSSKDDQDSYTALLERWERQVDDIEETEIAFEKLVHHAVEVQGGKRVLICVDNLDRCSPESVIKLLESVKVFFNTTGCIWLFAMDSDVVAGYITRRYQDTGLDGHSYLDKIIPEQYHLSLSPALDSRVIEGLLQHAVGSGNFQIDMAKIPQIPKILVPRRLIKSAKKFSDFYKSRFATRGISPEVVIGLSLLYHTWPDFYQHLSSGSKKHIRGMLDNFFEAEIDLSKKEEGIPLREVFLQDRELVYFIQTIFSGYNAATSEKYITEIINGLEGLREGGLP